MTPDRLYHASPWLLRDITVKAASEAVVDHH